MEQKQIEIDINILKDIIFEQVYNNKVLVRQLQILSDQNAQLTKLLNTTKEPPQ
jgi:hypothetical protein